MSDTLPSLSITGWDTPDNIDIEAKPPLPSVLQQAATTQAIKERDLLIRQMENRVLSELGDGRDRKNAENIGSLGSIPPITPDFTRSQSKSIETIVPNQEQSDILKKLQVFSPSPFYVEFKKKYGLQILLRYSPYYDTLGNIYLKGEPYPKLNKDGRYTGHGIEYFICLDENIGITEGIVQDIQINVNGNTLEKVFVPSDDHTKIRGETGNPTPSRQKYSISAPHTLSTIQQESVVTPKTDPSVGSVTNSSLPIFPTPTQKPHNLTEIFDESYPIPKKRPSKEELTTAPKAINKGSLNKREITSPATDNTPSLQDAPTIEEFKADWQKEQAFVNKHGVGFLNYDDFRDTPGKRYYATTRLSGGNSGELEYIYIALDGDIYKDSL